MAEAPGASTISPLNILFEDLQKEMDGNDVSKMKRLLRGKQLSKEEMEKLESASDVFHHLQERGIIDDNNLNLLVELFANLGKEPLKNKVVEFQREHASTTESKGFQLPKRERLSEGGQHSSELHEQTKCNLTNLTAKVAMEIDEEERESRNLDLKERRIKLEEREVNLELKKQLIEFLKNCIKEKDNAMFDKCVELFKECRADKSEPKIGSIFFILSFLTEEDLDYFWQKYKEGTVDKALTRILIPPTIKDKAEKAGITIRIKLEIDEKEYEEVKQRMHEMSAVSSSSRATWRQGKACSTGQWEAFVMDQVQDKQQAKNLLEQSKFDPVVDALRQEEFFFPAIVSFWFENSYTLPTTVTKATEYAVIHHAEMYCKENNVEIENLREILKARFNDIGMCLYDNITAENVGKLYLSWIDTCIPNLESHFFGLLTKSNDYYTFQSKYVYTYINAMYFSNIVALSPNNIPMLLREEKTRILQANLSYCLPYVAGILGEKALYFLEEVVKFSEMQTSVDISNLEMLGNCLFESERPSVFAREIEELIDENHYLDLSTCTGISNQSLHALSVILLHTSLIKDIKWHSESDEAFLSSEFKECLTNIIGDPFTVDRCTVSNVHDFTVTAKLLRILPLLCKHAQSRSSRDTTQQPAVTSLTISSNVSIFEEIKKCTMEMFIKALSCMPDLDNLSLTGFGEKLCEQFLLCLSEDTVSLNINMLCLAENDLSWEHCKLLLEAMNAMPCLTSLDLSNNIIGSLGCTVLLPIKDEIEVRVDYNIAQGLLEILPLCTSTAQVQDVGDLTLKSLDDVASLIGNLENVRHIDCTKLVNSQLSELCQNLSLLSNIVSIDVSGIKLDQQIVLLLCERLKHLKELQKVDLSHCCVSTDNMQVLLQHISPEVTDLNLSGMNMSGFLLTELKRFRNLKHLNLSNSNLKADDHVFKFIPTSVTHLNLSQNDLHEVNFENLENYTQLEGLDVSYNKLSLADIRKILKLISTSLTLLSISHNNLKRIDNSFEHLTNLRQLDLSNNGLLSCSILSLPSSITHLNLSHNQISFIGQKVNHLSQLTHLDMSHNQIVDIGQSFNHLSQLTHLDVSHNNLQLSLHSLLLHVSEKLKFLNISFNKIQNVHQAGNMISNFRQLCSINMNSNQLGAVGVQTLLSEIENYNINCDIDVSHNLFGLQKIIPYIVNQLPASAILPDFERENLTLKDEHLQVFFKSISKITTVEIPKSVEWSVIEYTSVLNDLSVFSNIESLSLAWLNPVTCPLLAETLINFSCLRRLDISGSKIDNKGVKVVGNALISLDKLVYINFSNTNIGISDIEFLLEIYRQHINQPFISVANNVHYLPAIFPYIEDQSKESSIASIDFDSDELHVKSFANVVQMTKLTKLKVKEKQWVNKDFNSFVQGLNYLNLDYLDLSHNNIGDSGAKSLSDVMRSMDGLTGLDLSHNNIGDSGAKSLSEVMRSMHGLTHLDLSHNNIGDSGAKSLSEVMRSMHGLSHLDLSHNNIGYYSDKKSLRVVMRSMDGLTHLDLSHNNIEDSGAKSLSDVMRSMHGYNHLDLSHNNIGDSGAKSLSEGMRSMDGLTHLDLSHNNIGDSGAMSLSEVMRSMHGLTRLDLSHNNIGDSGAKSLSEGMRSMHGLTHLDLSHNNIGDSGAESLSEGMRSMHGLTHLDLSHNNIGDSGAKSLSEGMRSMRRLTHLDLSHNKIGDSGAKSLSAVMRSIYEFNIDLSHNNIGDSDKKSLRVVMRSMHGYNHLDLSKNKIGDSGAKSLSHVMRSMHGLTGLDLSHNNIGNSGAKSLSEVMRSMHGLTHLDLSHNNIGDSGAKSLSEGMRSMRGLTHLDLSHNNIGDSGAKSLSEGMRSMRGLTHLDLSHNNIGDSGAKSLSEVMRSMRGLTHLDLSHNNIGDSGAKSLSEVMRSMYEFNLDLSHNNIGDSDKRSLRVVMRSMHGYNHLDLSQNDIGDSGAKSLSHVMRSMDELTHLDLSHNNIGDSGAKSLSEVMRSMDGLTHLDLSHNNIGDSGAKSLSEVMRSMRRLTHLDLSHNKIGDSGAKSLSKVMRSMRWTYSS
ncbi:protein NLRC5-like [Ptychodera flava]|uniref:protein NLRC5-like n=1 Tax=Ptychodera flava TaxID=63121 RepID=UPI00396A29FF